MRQEYNRRSGGQHAEEIGLHLLEVLIRIPGSGAEEIHDNPIIIQGDRKVAHITLSNYILLV
jgi:hypothetical protein